MAAFLYFVESDAPITNFAALESLGLRYAFDDMPTITKLDRGTPSGKGGLLLVDESRLRPAVPTYDPSLQTWRQFDGFWIGYWNDMLPTPEDLGRLEQLPGPEIKLCDGKRWIVPRVYVYRTERINQLPAYVDCDAVGRAIRGDTVDRYRYLLDVVEPFWAAYIDAYEKSLEAGSQQFVVSIDGINEAAAKVLGENYRVSLRELAILKSFRLASTAADVLGAACDIDAAALFLSYEFHKKKQSGEHSDSIDTVDG